MDMSGVLHNSISLDYRRPFGAVTDRESVFLRIDLPAGITARLRLWESGHERIVLGARTSSGMEFTFKPEAIGLVWYYFLLDTPEGLRYYGGRSGAGQVYAHEPPAFQITVYDRAFKTPAWFCEGLCYQIFPDRFARSVPSGHPERLSHHERMGRRVRWHKSFDEPVEYLPADGERDYDPCDFFGGDLAGIRQKLPYLSSLGISCIYLNPIFESPSTHRYNVSDYFRVDPVLGDEADLRALVSEAKALGIRIMLDGVFSHTGADSRYFDKNGAYGGGAYSDENSPYRKWYDFHSWPDDYRCWWGFKTLPEVNELEPSYMEFAASVLSHYASLGITSWRLDVADELPDEFIAFLRTRLKALAPDGVLLGEVWEDASNKEGFGTRRRYVDGGELDSAMGYPFMNAVADFLMHRTDSAGLRSRLTSVRENYPRPFYEAQLNLLGSHDTIRILTRLSGSPGRDSLTREEQAAYSPAPRELERGRARLVLALMLQMSVPGVPSVYYGDEAGLTGMADPFCRKPYPWGSEDKKLLSAFRVLASARAVNPALKRGLCGFASPRENVFAVLRCSEGASVISLVNRGEHSELIALSASDFTEGPDARSLFISPSYEDVLTHTRVETDSGSIYVVLPPLSGTFLISR